MTGSGNLPPGRALKEPVRLNADQREVLCRKTAEEWNASVPIGTKVRYWPILPPIASAPPVETTTRSESWELGSGHPVVKIAGKAGGVHLSHLEVLPWIERDKTCGALIRDGQTTIGDCQRERGHDGEHQRVHKEQP